MKTASSNGDLSAGFAEMAVPLNADVLPSALSHAALRRNMCRFIALNYKTSRPAVFAKKEIKLHKTA